MKKKAMKAQIKLMAEDLLAKDRHIEAVTKDLEFKNSLLAEPSDEDVMMDALFGEESKLDLLTQIKVARALAKSKTRTNVFGSSRFIKWSGRNAPAIIKTADIIKMTEEAIDKEKQNATE